MELQNRTIALIIDFDNFNKEEYLNILITELKTIGNIIYKGAFYTNTKDTKIEEKSIKYGFDDFIMEASYTKGKNAVDIRIALDVMELIQMEYIDCFCLATSDLDFTPIVKRIIKKNKIVIGAGTATTNEDYKNLFHRFINVEAIAKAQATKPIKAVVKSKKVPVLAPTMELAKGDTKLTELVLEIENILKNLDQEADGSCLFSTVIEMLYKKQPDFNPKNYGFRNNKASLFFKEVLNKHFTMKTVKKILYIRMAT